MPAIFFDIDGTLTRGVTSGGFLAARLGHAVAMDAAERAYARGEISNDEVCRIDAAGYRGRSVAEVRALLDELPLVDGIAETVAACRGRGFTPYVASLAWTVVGEWLCECLGFAGCYGSVLEVKDGVFTGRVVSAADEAGKAAYAQEVCVELGCDAGECVAVGDSRSDLELFAFVGRAIAFNGNEAARAAASASVEGASLTAILQSKVL